MPSATRKHPRGAAIGAPDIHVGAVVQQQLDGTDALSLASGDMQRRLALFAAQYVRVSAVSEEPPNALPHLWLAFDVMPREQEVQRCIAPVADKVEVHARVQEQLERFFMKELGRMKHGLAVGGICARIKQHPGEGQIHCAFQ